MLTSSMAMVCWLVDTSPLESVVSMVMLRDTPSVSRSSMRAMRTTPWSSTSNRSLSPPITRNVAPASTLPALSGSWATSVMPTAEPAARFSDTRLGDPLLSLAVAASFTSSMAMVKVWRDVDRSALVAVTSIVRVAPCVSRSMSAAVLTTPLVGSIWNSPFGLPLRL